jgi:hypothetical protein
MYWVYRRPPQAQYRQKRKLTPTLFVDEPVVSTLPRSVRNRRLTTVRM